MYNIFIHIFIYNTIYLFEAQIKLHFSEEKSVNDSNDNKSYQHLDWYA